MTLKLQCPACRTQTTEQTYAFAEDEPCPSCGCPAALYREVLAVQQSHADAELKARCELLLAEKANLEVENHRLKTLVAKLRGLLDEEVYG